MPPSARPTTFPRRGNVATRALGRVALKAFGWRLEGTFPDLPKFVVVGAPHTSNYDFLVTMATLFALGADAKWLAKHSLFRPPLGVLFRWMGGIPVNRGVQSGVVTASVAAFAEREALILCVAPEGTRSGVRSWRTGFYHIAVGARVPIVPCSADYATRVVRIGAPHLTTGDQEEDFARIRAFFRGVRGKHPPRRTEPADPN